MMIRVCRVYNIDTDMSCKDFIRMVNRYEMQTLGDPLETPNMREAAIGATYACDAGDMTEIVTDAGNEIVFIACEDPDLTLTWQMAWADDVEWP